MESVSLIDNVLFSMDTFLDHFSDTRRRERRIAFPPSVDWTRCNDELRNRVVGAIVVDGQVVLDRGVAGASATTARIALASPNAIEAGRSRGSLRASAAAAARRINCSTTKDGIYDAHNSSSSLLESIQTGKMPIVPQLLNHCIF